MKSRNGANGQLKPEEIERFVLGQQVWMRIEVKVELEPTVELSPDSYREKQYRTEIRELLYKVTTTGQKEVACRAVDHGGSMVYIHPFSCHKFRRA